MAREKETLKCGKCKESFPRATIVKVGSVNYCQPCLAKKNQPKEMTDWDYLYQYLRDEIYRVESLSMLTLKRLKDYRDNYGYTNIGMYYTLKYINETLGKEVYDDGLLSQIPYYYDKAKEHVLRVIELENISEEFEMDSKVIKVVVGNRQTWSPKKPLNLGTIDWSEEDED